MCAMVRNTAKPAVDDAAISGRPTDAPWDGWFF